jgi:hypothetical protein
MAKVLDQNTLKDGKHYYSLGCWNVQLSLAPVEELIRKSEVLYIGLQNEWNVDIVLKSPYIMEGKKYAALKRTMGIAYLHISQAYDTSYYTLYTALRRKGHYLTNQTVIYSEANKAYYCDLGGNIIASMSANTGRLLINQHNEPYSMFDPSEGELRELALKTYRQAVDIPGLQLNVKK